MNKNYFFGYRKKLSYTVVLLFVLLFSLFVTTTLAFFFESEFASNNITMTGKVHIEAVGAGDRYDSIEDTTSSNLKVVLSDGLEVLTPGMTMRFDANCKVYQSTTKPLLRAKFGVFLSDKDTGENLSGEEYVDEYAFLNVMYVALQDIVIRNGWFLHSDGYYYHIEDGQNPTTANEDNLILKEVDATSGDKVVIFVNDSITFPTDVTEVYSGYSVTIKITFQAIQNFLPNDKGQKLSNTIKNSRDIFNSFPSSSLEFTDNAYFRIFLNEDNKWEIEPKSVINMPENLVLPSTTPNGDQITVIGSKFRGNNVIKRLTVPSSYTEIESHAFEGSSIEYCDLSQSSISELPVYCFYSSKLSEIILPQNLYKLNSGCLQSTQITSIDLPYNLGEINSSALAYCKIGAIFVPAGVNTIGANALRLSNCTKMIVDSNNIYFKSIDDQVITNIDGTKLICSVSNVITGKDELSIPETVKELGSYSLNNLQVKKLILPKSLEEIGDYVFSGYIEDIVIDEDNPNFTTDSTGRAILGLDDYGVPTEFVVLAVNDPNSNYTVPESIKTFKGGCFNGCTVQTLYLGSQADPNSSFTALTASYFNVSSSNPYCYADSNGKALIKFGTGNNLNKNTLIRYAINNSATSYIVPSNVITINGSAFATAKNLVSVNLPEGLITLGGSAFSGCSSLTSINSYNPETSERINNSIPTTINSFGNSCVANTKITEMQVYGVIGENAFVNCKELKKVVIHESCDAIDVSVFKNCTALETVEFKDIEPPSLLGDMFLNAPSTVKYYVPDDALNNYIDSGDHYSSYRSQFYVVSEMPTT